jgi:PLP dependent protein
MSDDAAPVTTSERIAAIRQRIAVACERGQRDPAGVTLIAVSKTFPANAVEAGWKAGLRDFGENRVQEGVAKAAELEKAGIVPSWHLIGHLQRNKAKEAMQCFAILHAVDSERLLEAIEAAGLPPVRICLEVNVAAEETKFGVSPAEAGRLAAFARSLGRVRLQGLMTVAPRAANPEAVRPVFRSLRELAGDLGLGMLSMGMSEDFEVAIEEGSTHVRIGRAIFGERA